MCNYEKTDEQEVPPCRDITARQTFNMLGL